MVQQGKGDRARGPERDGGKERFWREMVRRWRRRSGATIRDFCAEHGLSEPSFYAWRRTITERDERAERAARRPAKRARQPAAQVAESGNDDGIADGLPAFVPLRVTPAEPVSALEVVVGQGRVVRVARGFDAATLRSLLAVLEEAPAC